MSETEADPAPRPRNQPPRSTPRIAPAPAGEITPEMRAIWPAYFDGGLADDAPREGALPVAGADLAPFLEARIPGPPAGTWPGRARNLVRHFRILEPEFGGCLRITHLLACVCVVLRRETANPRALALFHDITRNHGALIAADTNLRWLTAVCDTFADCGATPLDRSIGMTGTLVANIVKLAETERRKFHPPRAWPPATAMWAGGALYDGVISYWVGRGDMIENMFGRVEAVMDPASPASAFTREVLERVFTHDTFLARLLAVQDGRTFPLAPEARRAAAKAAMRGL